MLGGRAAGVGVLRRKGVHTRVGVRTFTSTTLHQEAVVEEKEPLPTSARPKEPWSMDKVPAAASKAANVYISLGRSKETSTRSDYISLFCLMLVRKSEIVFLSQPCLYKFACFSGYEAKNEKDANEGLGNLDMMLQVLLTGKKKAEMTFDDALEKMEALQTIGKHYHQQGHMTKAKNYYIRFPDIFVNFYKMKTIARDFGSDLSFQKRYLLDLYGIRNLGYKKALEECEAIAEARRLILQEFYAEDDLRGGMKKDLPEQHFVIFDRSRG